MKNFVDIKDFTAAEINAVLNSAIENKNHNLSPEVLLSGKNLILFFEKNSTRTRLSFDLAVKQLGGSSIILNGSDIHLSSGKESLSDTIKTFGLYSDGVVMRVNNHQTILDTIEVSSVPIINGLSNLSHPCQCMAGLMTIIEEKGSLENLNITWFGPITNVAHSWIEAHSKNLGFKFSIFSPDRSRELYLSKITKYKENLNLANGKYDLIIHGMALHWANDPVGQLIQARLALKNDGLMIAVCLGGTTLNELRNVFIEAETKLFGGIHPRFMPLAEIRDLGSLIQRAGFTLPVADSVITECLYNGFYKILHDLRAMAETNVLINRTKYFSRRGLFQYASELYQKQYSRPGKMVSATYEHIYLTGWAPDPSQQKPLRPGSAQSRLADALRSKESY